MQFNNLPRLLFIFVLMSIVRPQIFAADAGAVTIVDASHYSNVFGETRHYRIFLPPGYATDKEKKYPVIYFFHGWSQRYFGSSNPYGDFDKGNENGGDNISRFVSTHDVIVVKSDGYNRSMDEPYYVRPYNVLPVETHRQFPIYFPELVHHIDTHYRTIPDRAHRGISGLSMGGFMTFWIGGKYPHLVSAAGNFCGSPEFVAGPKDFPVEYRHIDMYKNYEGMNVRLHYGNKDFIRGYHEDLNKVWLQVADNYSYKVFDAAHSTCGLGEMFEFIFKTFENPPPRPSRWHHTDIYPVFNVWDHEIWTDRAVPGFTTIENVDTRGFRCSVRSFLPDGELMPSVAVTVKTPPVYEKDQFYTINDIDVQNARTTQKTVRSDSQGSLTIALNGGLHEIGINKKQDRANLAIATVRLAGSPWASTREDVSIKVKVLNKGLTAAKKVRATLSATRPSAKVIRKEAAIANIAVNGDADIDLAFRVDADTVEIERFKLTLLDENNEEWTEYFEIPLRKKHAEIKNFIIADGKSFIVASSGDKTDTLLLGHGNGDGIANPGESIVILVKEQDKLWRADLDGTNDWVNPFGASVRMSDSWTSFDHVGGSAKYDVPLISSECPQNHQLTFFVEYWLPEYPLHIIKRGVVKVRVTGKDTTTPTLERVRATADNVVHVKLSDGSRLKSVKATLTDEKDPKKSIITVLHDDGRDGDRVEGDFIFSATVPSQVFGIFKAHIEAEDSYGNRAEWTPDEKFVLH